ncbi:MAG TPA: hypothetical protein VK206_21055, partial [Anaerolineales bacterium]|nr:hypothetical protein [Anaerolineales bacterium]
GTRSRHLDGTSFEPRKLPENAHAVPTGSSPTSWVHVAKHPAQRGCVRRFSTLATLDPFCTVRVNRHSHS